MGWTRKKEGVSLATVPYLHDIDARQEDSIQPAWRHPCVPVDLCPCERARNRGSAARLVWVARGERFGWVWVGREGSRRHLPYHGQTMSTPMPTPVTCCLDDAEGTSNVVERALRGWVDPNSVGAIPNKSSTRDGLVTSACEGGRQQGVQGQYVSKSRSCHGFLRVPKRMHWLSSPPSSPSVREKGSEGATQLLRIGTSHRARSRSKGPGKAADLDLCCVSGLIRSTQTVLRVALSKTLHSSLLDGQKEKLHPGCKREQRSRGISPRH